MATAIVTHETTEPPLPGGARGEYIEATVDATGTISITLDLAYSSKPTVTATAIQGATTEDVNVTVVDDDPTGDGTISVRVSSATAEEKGLFVQVLEPLEEQ